MHSCFFFTKINTITDKAAQFYVLAFGANSASNRFDCQTMFGTSWNKPLKFTRYSVRERQRVCVCVCVCEGKGHTCVYAHGGEGVLEVLQHLCSLGICTVLELLHIFIRLSEYGHASLDDGDTFWEMRQVISWSCERHSVSLHKPWNLASTWPPYGWKSSRTSVSRIGRFHPYRRFALASNFPPQSAYLEFSKILTTVVYVVRCYAAHDCI